MIKFHCITMILLSILIIVLSICSQTGKAELQSNVKRVPRPNAFTKHLNLTDWKVYVKTFSKFYDDLTEDNEIRRMLFEEKVRTIQDWNEEYSRGIHSYSKGINPFTAKTADEMRRMMTSNVMEANQTAQRHQKANWVPADEDTSLGYRRRKRLPASFDWRHREGIVPEVKYQGDCNACYSFTVLDTIEARYNLYKGISETLSTQMVVDCSGYVNDGCEGGWLDKTFQYVLDTGGVVLDYQYPYEGRIGRCRMYGKRLRYPIKDLGYVEAGNERALKKQLVIGGPIAVAFDSESHAFQVYSGGIHDDPSCKTDNLKHSGLLVGYGTEYGVDYWIIKNSWSEYWGEEGYIRIKRNYGNRCGVASLAMYPII